MENTSQMGQSGDQSMLKKFFIEELSDIYSAEKQLTEALPKLEEAATSPDLAMAFSDHLQVTQQQVARLEQIFQLLGEEPENKTCEGMEGLIREGQSIMSDTETDTATRDVGLIVSSQKVEHYEIAAYGSLRQLARTMGNDDVSRLLEESLKEEKEADMLLSNLAETMINEQAKQEAAG